MSTVGSNMEPVTASQRGLRWTGVIVALVLPSIITWVYFIEVADYPPFVQQATGVAVKSVQFLLPVMWVGWVLGERLGWPRPTARGVGTGVLFGLFVVAAAWLMYHTVLRDTALFMEAAENIRAKLIDLGLDSLTRFVALAAFYSLVHSLLEEYYWRWFAFGQLRRLIRLWPAIVVAAVGFTAHHVIVLSLYFGWWTWPTMLFSLAVAAGGMFWAWLYERSGSIYGPWLSHLVIDAGIFWIAYDLLV